MPSFLDKIVSHGPKLKVLTKDQAARSVVVQNIPQDAIAVSTIIHFQRRKNGGGEVDHAHIPEKGTAVITFESSEVPERVLKHCQTLDGSELVLDRFISTEFPEVFQQAKARANGIASQLPYSKYHSMFKNLKENMEVACLLGRNRNFTLSGTFNQIVAARTLLLRVKGFNFELVSAELCLEFVECLSRETIAVLLRKVAAQTGIKWIESADCFIMSRTFKQMEESRSMLKQAIHKSNGIVVLNDEVPEKCVEEGSTAFTEQQRLETELVRMRQSLNNEIRLRSTRERDLSDKERTVEQLQRSLEEERQERSRLDEEIRQVRIACTELEERLQAEQLSSRSWQLGLSELQRRLEQEQQQKEALERRLIGFALQMEEERGRHLSAERELQAAVSAAEEAVAEYQSCQSRDWIVQREEIVLSEDILGEGAWGSVRKGIFRGCQVAVKEIHKLILSEYNRRLFEREMSFASRCRHPNLLQFIGATNDDDSPLFVTELLDTSLRHVLSQRALKHKEIIILALDIAKGLNYLHLNKPRPIMHRDISSANVLLWRRGESWRAKLSDYGAANFMRLSMTVNPGAIIYAAPEAFTPQQTSKVDVYSFGVLLCEMCIREQPDPQELHNQIGRVNGVLRGLIQRYVKRNPEARPTMSDAICELKQQQ